MQPAIHKGALLARAIATALAISMAATVASFAQPHPRSKEKARRLVHKLPRKAARRRADFALTYTGEAAKIAEAPGTGLWLNGAAVDGALTFYGDLGLAANFSVVHSEDISAGVSLGKGSIVFGPRVTIETSKWLNKRKFLTLRRLPPSDLYAQALFGVAHGFDGLFPRSLAPSASANSSAIHLGIGADFTVWKNFGIRPFELDYIRTGLPNGTSNSQNDLRLSFGVTYHMDLYPKPPAETSVPAQP